MSIAKITYDDCEKNGLEHAWKYFKVKYTDPIFTTVVGSISNCGPIEVPETDLGACRSSKKTVAIRRCLNCKIKESKIEEFEETWVR